MERSHPEPKNTKLEQLRKRVKLTMPSIVLKHENIGSSNIEMDSDLQSQVSVSPMTPADQKAGFSNLNFFKPQKAIAKNVFEEHYEILEKLGEGANGVIRKCKSKLTGKTEAVKIGQMQEEHIIILKKIAKIARKISHDHILKMKELYLDSKRHKYYQIMEYLPYPSLKKLIEDKHLFSNAKIRKIMRQLLQALDYLRQHHIVHRDIKSENLLYDVENEHLYVIDLGIITKTVERGRRRNLWSNTGTLEYKAPETLEFSSYNEAVDMWAAGVVLYELVEGRTPFLQQTQIDTIQNITQIKYEFTLEKWAEIPLAKALVQRILKPKSERLNSSDSLKDPWFQLMDYKQLYYEKQKSPFRKPKFISYNSIPADSNPFNSEQAKSYLLLNSQQDNDIVNRFELFRASSYKIHSKEGAGINAVKSSKELFQNVDDHGIINNNH